MSSSTVRFQGRIWRVQKQPFETEEQARDRAWYITKLPIDMSSLCKENESRVWANQKYYQMKYQSVQHERCES